VKIISIFNNKGGVGKTTLAYHLAHILAEKGKRVLIFDLDSQCNMSLYGMPEEDLEKIWEAEDDIIENGFDFGKPRVGENDFNDLFKTTRTIHFILKSVEERIVEVDKLPPPFEVSPNLGLIPSRLTLFQYEKRIMERWSGMFVGDSLSIKTITGIRKLAELYSAKYQYDFVIIDTSPNLGALNMVIISTVDGFVIPCLPDMFSLYGIKNIGKALREWQRHFDTCFQIIPDRKRQEFPKKFVRFLGYTIYNAKKYDNSPDRWGLARAHYNYAQKIPDAIKMHIAEGVRQGLSEEMVTTPIGKNAVLYSHHTLTNMAQKYRKPMWVLPDYNALEADDKRTISGNPHYKNTRTMYETFADDFLKRVKTLDD